MRLEPGIIPGRPVRCLCAIRWAARHGAASQPPCAAGIGPQRPIHRHHRGSQRNHVSSRHTRHASGGTAARNNGSLRRAGIRVSCRRPDVWNLHSNVRALSIDAGRAVHDFSRLRVGFLPSLVYCDFVSFPGPLVGGRALVVCIFRRPVVLRSAARSRQGHSLTGERTCSGRTPSPRI